MSEPKKEDKDSIFAQPYVDPEKSHVGEKKFFGPKSSKPNFFNSKIRPPSNVSAKKKLEPETNPKSIPKKTEKILPPSKIPRISDESGKASKKSSFVSKDKKEEPRPKTPEDAPIKPVVAPIKPVAAPIKLVDASTKPVDASIKPVVAPIKPVDTPIKPVVAPIKPVVAPIKPVDASIKPETAPIKLDVTEIPKEPIKKRPTSSVEKKRGLKEKSPASRPPSRPTAAPRAKKESEPEKKKPEEESAEKYLPEPSMIDKLELFEEVKEPGKDLSLFERLQQNFKSYFTSPRASEAAAEPAVEDKTKKKFFEGGFHFR